MKILNLYAGIGGNRKLWGDEHQVTAVEMNPKVAAVYAAMYPNDTVVVGDAHEYLRKHFTEFDFVWSSPVCKTHSRMRYNIAVRLRGTEPKYPDFTLYEQVVFLQHHFDGKWVVENVIPYYNEGLPLIPATQINRHLYWSNFELPRAEKMHENLRAATVADLEALHGFDLSGYDLPNKREALRNCVPPELGRAILNAALGRELAPVAGGLFDMLTDPSDGDS